MTAQEQSVKEEIKRQLDILWVERWGRLPLAMLAFLLATSFLPWWVTLACAITNVSAELLAMHYMRALEPKRHPKRYRFIMVLMFVMQAAYVLPPVLIWQMNEVYAKAFAVGMVMTTPLQMISGRAIHLPFGISGYMASVVLVLSGNSYYWLRAENYKVFLFSTVCVIGVLAYSLISMRSNNRLHIAAAADRKAAQDTSKAQSRFLTQMSHELRTPLNAILGMGHAELRRSRDSVSQNRLSVLIASAEGLSTILDDIMDISAIEAGRLPIRPLRVIPAEEIGATLLLFQPGIQEAGLTLTHDIGAGLDMPWVLDPQRLRQCLSNLLSNAVKNTLNGGIHVSSQLFETAAGTMLQVQVADTGPGIPAHLHRALFEPFMQGRSPRPGTQSNGLGLSISRNMARLMGGDLTLLPNEPDTSGARFLLSLKLERPAEITEAPRPETPARTPAQMAGLKVLVIDDIATNRLVASTYLRMLGATMIEAESGAQALEILPQTNPDLVLLDMNMPGMNGLQTLEKMRELPDGLGKIPVIAMTADTMAEHRNLYLSSGLDGYLAKPINPARIEAEIKAVLDKYAKD